MKSVVTIYLNDIGQKALNSKTKIIYIDQDPDKVEETTIYNLFPKELINKIDIEKSFYGLERGSNVIVVNSDGDRFLGTVSGSLGKTVTVNLEEGRGFYPRQITFNFNGVEATHSKQKHRLEWASQEEIDKIKELLEKQPFLEILHKLADSSGDAIKIDDEKVVVPEWLTTEGINILHDQICYQSFEDDEDD